MCFKLRKKALSFFCFILLLRLYTSTVLPFFFFLPIRCLFFLSSFFFLKQRGSLNLKDKKKVKWAFVDNSNCCMPSFFCVCVFVCFLFPTFFFFFFCLSFLFVLAPFLSPFYIFFFCIFPYRSRMWCCAPSPYNYPVVAS